MFPLPHVALTGKFCSTHILPTTSCSCLLQKWAQHRMYIPLVKHSMDVNLTMGILPNNVCGIKVALNTSPELTKLQPLRRIPSTVLWRTVRRSRVAGRCGHPAKSDSSFRCPHAGRWRYVCPRRCWSGQWLFCMRTRTILRILRICLFLLLQRARRRLLKAKRAHASREIAMDSQ
jgi:hypothetical protein